MEDMAAIDRALSTVELLEEILLYLSMLEIIRKKRVCKTWSSCIAGSVAIRRKLFLEAETPSKLPAVQNHHQYMAPPVALNPLLGNVFRIRHSDISGSSVGIIPRKDRRRLYAASTQENVLEVTPSGTLRNTKDRGLILDVPSFYRHRHRSRAARTAFTDVVQTPYSIAAELQNNLTMEGWACMLLTQPPLASVSIRDPSNGCETRGQRVTALDGIGLTLGELLEAAVAYYGPSRPSGLKLDTEMELYQPVHFSILPGKPVSYMTDGRRVTVEDDEEVGFQRAWRTRLKCNLG